MQVSRAGFQGRVPEQRSKAGFCSRVPWQVFRAGSQGSAQLIYTCRPPSPEGNGLEGMGTTSGQGSREALQGRIQGQKFCCRFHGSVLRKHPRQSCTTGLQ